MTVLLVTFRLPGIDEPAFRQLARNAAPRIAGAPGLLGKTWLADHDTSTYGGLVLFDSPQALDAYLASEIIRELRSDPRLTEFATIRFDTLAEASRMTRGLLPLASQAPARRQVGTRRRLVWRTHQSPPELIAEPTWEDAEWR